MSFVTEFNKLLNLSVQSEPNVNSLMQGAHQISIIYLVSIRYQIDTNKNENRYLIDTNYLKNRYQNSN